MIDIRQLGLIPYREAWALQEELRVARAQGMIPDTLLLCEHPPVFTVGRQDCRADWRATFDTIARAGIEVIPVNRGGRITYHGPGQLVGYFIVDVRARPVGIRGFVTAIEALLIRTLDRFGVAGIRDAQYPGVWVGVDSHGHARGNLPSEHREREGEAPPALPVEGATRAPVIEKVAAIGLHVSRGITQHGFALNVAPRMDAYAYILPCGIPDRGVTSLARLLDGAAPSMAQVTAAVVVEVQGCLRTQEHRNFGT